MSSAIIAERPTEAPPSAEVSAQPPSGFIKRHPVLSFYLLTFAISWGGIVLLITGGGSSIPGSREQVQRLMPFAIPFVLLGPSIAGMLMTGLVDGRAGFREVVSCLTRWRVGVGWYAVALFAAPLVFMAVQLGLSIRSPVFLPGILVTTDKATLLQTGFAAALMVGFFEELGWMGFAVPRLRLRYGLLSTGLIAGALWGAWHILFQDLWGGPSLGGGATYSGEFPMPVFLTLFGVSLVIGQLPAFRVLMVWVYDRTGSLLVAMLMHASLDAATFILGAASTTASAMLTGAFAVGVAMWLVVAGVGLVSGGQLARKPLEKRAAAQA